jgi:PEP-CTERM motif
VRSLQYAVAFGIASLASSAPANAVTIILDQSELNEVGPGFWTRTTEFFLPSGAINIILNITGFSADDRAVLTLNGTEITSTGIFGPGVGFFQFTASGPNVPYTFAGGGHPNDPFEPLNLNVTSGFLTGLNKLTFIINNTTEGIQGHVWDDIYPNDSGQLSYRFRGSVSFTPAIPEPATWVMMIAGFGMAGAALRRRRAKVRVTYA